MLQDNLVRAFVIYKMVGKVLTIAFYAVVIVGFLVILGFTALARVLGSSDLALLVVGLSVGAPILAGAVKVIRWARAQQQDERDRGVEPVSPLWRILVMGGRTEKRKQLLLRDWPKACANSGLKPVPRLLDLQRTREGDYRAIITSKSGLSVDKVAPEVGRLARVLGCEDMSFREVGGGRAVVEFYWTKPLEREVKPQDLSPAPKGHVSIGLSRSGTLTLPVLNRRGESTLTPILVGATTGAGKSGWVHALIGGYLAAGIPLRVWIYDPKGKEFAAYGRHVGDSSNPRFTVAAYSGEEGGDVAMLKAMHEELRERMTRQEGRASVVSIAEPINLFLCDEWFELTKSMVDSKSSPLRRIMYIGRGFGFSAVCLVQDPTVEAMGGLRRLFDRRVGLRTQALESTVAIFGSAWKAKLAPCHDIRRYGTAGTFYMDDDLDLAKGRAAYYDDDDLELLARGLLPAGAVEGGDRTCYVYTYRAWNAQEQRPEVVYIGESFDVDERWKEHRRDGKPWVARTLRFRQMTEAGGPDLWRTSEPHPSKKAARAAEQAAIAAAVEAGEPLENVVHNTKRRRLQAVA